MTRKQRRMARKARRIARTAGTALLAAMAAAVMIAAGPEPQEAQASVDPETAGKILVEGQIYMSESEYEQMKAERAAVIEAERQAEALLILEAPPAETMPAGGWEPAMAELVTEPAFLIAECTLPEDTQRAIREICDARGVPYSLIMSMAMTESEFNPAAKGDGGKSKGLLQIQTRFYPEEVAATSLTDIFDPLQNAALATEIIARRLEWYGDTHKALMAYNMGDPSAKKAWKNGRTSSAYSREIVERAARYEEELTR